MSDELCIIAYRTEAALLELADLLQNGPVLKITHRFRQPGTGCLPGEEIWCVSLLNRTREFPLPLTLALRLLLNYLADTRHTPQSATQIAAGIRHSPFYTMHGANSGMASRRRISRSAIKEYVKRLRKAFSIVIGQSGINLDARRVLVSQGTMGNEIQYQLRATIQWVHIPAGD